MKQTFDISDQDKRIFDEVNKENFTEDSSCAEDYSKGTKIFSINKIRHEYIISALVLFFLLFGIALDFFDVSFFTGIVPFVWYFILYVIIAGKTIIKAGISILCREFYNEYVMMTLATMGAFVIGLYSEGVALMLFFIIGELFQEYMLLKAKNSIHNLLKVSINEVAVMEGDKIVIKHPKDVQIGQIIQVKPNEKVGLDGKLISKNACLNASALNGELKPKDIEKGETVLAGMVNLKEVIEVKVTTLYKNTKLSKILKLVQETSDNKAKTQLLVNRLVKKFIPLVFWLSVALVVAPFFLLGEEYEFHIWFQKALIFLVVSFPLGLVTSISLGYLGGVGVAFNSGILFKGFNYLELITKVDTVVIDKTGVLTKGVFEVQDIVVKDFNYEKFLILTSVLEKSSNHSIAKAIVKFSDAENNFYKATNVIELLGFGIKGKVNNYELIIGNAKLMDKNNISIEKKLRKLEGTVVFVAINQKFKGYYIIEDILKKGSKDAVNELKSIKNIKEVLILSDDKQSTIEKIDKVENLKSKGKTVIFIEASKSDNPVITSADVGMVMDGIGNYAAMETADVVIQSDHPSKIAKAILIGNKTKRIIWQNIFVTFGMKIGILILAAFSMLTIWEAVFTDVAVSLLVIMNAVRIQKMRF